MDSEHHLPGFVVGVVILLGELPIRVTSPSCQSWIGEVAERVRTSIGHMYTQHLWGLHTAPKSFKDITWVRKVPVTRGATRIPSKGRNKEDVMHRLKGLIHLAFVFLIELSGDCS